MGMKKSKWLSALDALAVFFLAVLGAIKDSPPPNSPNILWRNIITFLIQYRVLIIILSAGYIVVYKLIPKWFYFIECKRKLKRNILQQISTDLFDKDLDKHRITLFRETNWLCAIARNYWFLIYHLFLYREKARLYLRWPRFGSYLIVDARRGLHCEKSSTMFRVEVTKEGKCNGVAGYIRFQRVSVSKNNLPNINDIDFSQFPSIEDIRPVYRQEDVRRYMRDGYIRDYATIKKMHRMARHFYGTIIEKENGTPWGVLLVDSTSDESPFTDDVKKQFDSFALTMSGIINMEE